MWVLAHCLHYSYNPANLTCRTQLIPMDECWDEWQDKLKQGSMIKAWLFKMPSALYITIFWKQPNVINIIRKVIITKSPLIKYCFQLQIDDLTEGRYSSTTALNRYLQQQKKFLSITGTLIRLPVTTPDLTCQDYLPVNMRYVFQCTWTKLLSLMHLNNCKQAEVGMPQLLVFSTNRTIKWHNE